ncbi:HAD-IIIA family hydrolase [Actinomadura rudentiformis]|uniref:D,D-heptose 1,7-bisphosphate phosphatase n=1 Tax=Actinomadura rudentiformis TaxID=359158 RepID=A0A6H9YVR5_9ACTN|nr:HAD-IIIA family hydrolase [Actinomadura rudentiformis]KAB2352717.1 HAD-IIIA family hydrolase [Actinomadura rudentiformis]
MTAPPSYTVVVPTVGRPSLRTLIESLAAGSGPQPAEVLIVDDRPAPGAPLPLPATAGDTVRVLRSGGRGPAAARNTGWRAATTEWVVFVDDDVVLAPDWPARTAADLTGLPDDVGGVQGSVRVPLPCGRRPTDWERNTAGLARASWITADMAYRRSVLADIGGFDERFRRAYREDSDLALRVMDSGHRLVRGGRQVTHPARPAGFWASLRVQAGNADDMLMWRMHGRGWRDRARAGRGRFRRHLAATGSGLAALAAWRAGARPAATAAVVLWAALTAEFAAARIAPGPRTPAEIARMLVTSVAIPPAAVWHRLQGLARHRNATPWQRARVVLFDRDDTLIRDVPYNGDPARVEAMPGARQALDRLRRRGLRIGVVSNQSGVAKGLIGTADVHRVNEQVERVLGPVDVWEFCPHDDADGCRCRKPGPAMIEDAARRLGVIPSECVVIGDIGRDMDAAEAAGARGILVPTSRTRLEEIARAAEVAPDLGAAVDRVLGERRTR